ncbi:hypothetical protein [Bradyrhizobium sp. Ash2021]|uniref:hypothetical protein n=1 Tax=Bradyrhizobium sp. Ash2021 TaxID=2954771 RepID=UPI0028159162|nr:hypothetical protein [Bradyrhizobium sp. Ash2021]WMT71911.1 hypothetical protein NL528_28030 [Bradyrhizobium sp. Ash2021]
METTRKVTQAQIDFGRRLGLELSEKSIGVAHALIQDAIQRSFFGKNDLGSPTSKQIELAMKFGFDIRHETRGVGDAVIADIMDGLNCRGIVEQRLAVGVRVRNKHDTLNREWVISSISADGTVYFKGGNGARAWARSLVRITTGEQ